MGSQCSPAGQCGRQLQPLYMESLGHGDAKAMFCEPLGVMKVSWECPKTVGQDTMLQTIFVFSIKQF